MTLRGKIAIAMALLTAVTAIIVATTTYVVTDQRVRVEVDQYLDAYAQRFQDPDGRQAAVIARTDYAATLEFGGTQGGRQILPRPFMNPSLEEDRPIFMRELKEAIQ